MTDTSAPIAAPPHPVAQTFRMLWRDKFALVAAIYLIVGSRHPDNICHYPGLDMLATPRGMTHLDGTPYPTTGEEND